MMTYEQLRNNITCCNKNWVPLYYTEHGWCTGGDYENCPTYTDEEIDSAEVLEFDSFGYIVEARLNLE